MTTETDQARVTDTVQPVVRLSEIRGGAEPPDYVTRGCRNLEQAAATLEAWVRELREFVRDHRSKDPVRGVRTRSKAEHRKRGSEVKRSGTNVDLLACPYCGATAEALDKRNGKGVYAYMGSPSSDIEPWMHVACLECGSGSPSAKVWNSRKAERES
jgi:hypothetical protein